MLKSPSTSLFPTRIFIPITSALFARWRRSSRGWRRHRAQPLSPGRSEGQEGREGKGRSCRAESEDGDWGRRRAPTTILPGPLRAKDGRQRLEQQIDVEQERPV